MCFISLFSSYAVVVSFFRLVERDKAHHISTPLRDNWPDILVGFSAKGFLLFPQIPVLRGGEKTLYFAKVDVVRKWALPDF